jgi:glycosyltransferase 2 family protein
VTTRENPVKWIAIAIKLGISGLLAWLVLKHVDFAAAGALLGNRRGAVALVLAMALLAGGAAIAGVRTACVMRIMGAHCSIGRGIAVWMVGLVISQSLITFIAGDAARVWQFARLGYSPRTASSAVVLERALGFAVLLVMVLLFEPVLLARASPGPVRTGLIVLAVLCAGGILAFVASAFLGRLQAYLPAAAREHRLVSIAIDVASAARHLTGSWKLGAVIIFLSLLMQLGNSLALFVLARAVGVSLDFVAVLAVSLPALLIAAMPIAIAGWGVREGAMIVGFGLFGVAPAPALAVSIAFGLAMLLVSLPGALFIRWGKQKQAAAPA